METGRKIGENGEKTSEKLKFFHGYKNGRVAPFTRLGRPGEIRARQGQMQKNRLGDARREEKEGFCIKKQVSHVEESNSPLVLAGSPRGDLEIIGGDLDWFDETKNPKWEMDKETSRRLLGGVLDEKHRGEVKLTYKTLTRLKSKVESLENATRQVSQQVSKKHCKRGEREIDKEEITQDKKEDTSSRGPLLKGLYFMLTCT